MAVSPISSVSFRGNYNQVNFEGKKREKDSGMHVSNTIKAIPLATVIAMSPLVDAYAQDNVVFPESNLKKELYSEINDNDIKVAKSFLRANEINWAEPHGMTVITAYDSDGDASDYEKLVIDVRPPAGAKGASTKMYVRGLTIASTYNKDTGKTTKEYIIEGARTKSFKKADGTVVEKRQPGVSKKVSKEVFDTLRDRLGDSIKVKTENITTDNDTEAENAILFDM